MPYFTLQGCRVWMREMLGGLAEVTEKWKTYKGANMVLLKVGSMISVSLGGSAKLRNPPDLSWPPTRLKHLARLVKGALLLGYSSPLVLNILYGKWNNLPASVDTCKRRKETRGPSAGHPAVNPASLAMLIYFLHFFTLRLSIRVIIKLWRRQRSVAFPSAE